MVLPCAYEMEANLSREHNPKLLVGTREMNYETIHQNSEGRLSGV